MGIDKIIKYYKKPKNRGKMRDADAIGEDIALCGDTMAFFIKVGKRKIGKREVNYIKDIKFETMGCAVAIATASITTEMAKGRTIEEAKKITEKEIAREIGGVPEAKFHCIALTLGTLRNAIENWEKKKKIKKDIKAIITNRHINRLVKLLRRDDMKRKKSRKYPNNRQ